jgi:peptidoglycan/LPS O-acetylase OafA/YrhL
MPSARLPQFRLLAHTNLNQDYNHSILIAVLRGLAAVQVAAAHLRAEVFPGLTGMQDPTLWYQALGFLTGFAYQAVVVFFLLSGWLVGGSFLNKLHEPGAMTSYAVDRMTRLWIVLIPAFVLTLAIGAYTGAVDPGTFSYAVANEYSAASFLGNLFGLQDIVLPRFGGNFPLWSLANETWYYVLFPLLVIPFSGKSTFSRVASAAVCLLVARNLPGSIVLYFSLWLLGAAFSRIEITASATQRWTVLLVLVIVAVYLRLKGIKQINEASFVSYLVVSLPFLLLLSSLQFRSDPQRSSIRFAKRIGTLLAGFSFTLYVIHVPLLMLLRDLYPPLRSGYLSPRDLANLGSYCIMLACILVLSYLFHLPFEAQTHRVRSFIKTKIMAASHALTPHAGSAL